MTGESYNRVPTGKIITRGEPLINVEKILTAAAKPGMLVEIDGNDYKCKPATADSKPAGWISYEHTPYNSRPDNYETELVAGDVVSVVSGGNFVIYTLVTGGSSETTINIGDHLKSKGDGTLEASADAGDEVAIAAESVTISASTVVRLHVRSLI